jgi:DnaJ family protein C protein 2
LGFASTPIDEVKKFYKFWDQFKTWRTFNQYDEYDENDLESAQDRFEKRWMEKQNQKCRAQYDKAERKRIFNMVNLAYENDPRIKAEREKEDAEREAKKQAKKDAIQAKYKEIEERKAEQERLQKEAEQEEERKKQQATEQKKEAGKLYKNTCKEFCLYCVSKMPTSQFDKFYIAEMVKKFPK